MEPGRKTDSRSQFYTIKLRLPEHYSVVDPTIRFFATGAFAPEDTSAIHDSPKHNRRRNEGQHGGQCEFHSQGECFVLSQDTPVRTRLTELLLFNDTRQELSYLTPMRIDPAIPDEDKKLFRQLKARNK